MAGLLDRSTTVQRTADLLRDQVLAGQHAAGAQMAELALSSGLGISRGTLREAFQVLIGERLLVHEPHRGVFVRRLSVADVRDIYAFRRLVECAALARPTDPRGLGAMREAVASGQEAAARRAWPEVGTADVRFHMGVTAVAGSSRLDRAVRALFAELRLAFQLVPDAQALHEPFLERNAEILALCEGGGHDKASAVLEGYLDEAEEFVVGHLTGGSG